LPEQGFVSMHFNHVVAPSNALQELPTAAGDDVEWRWKWF